MRDLAKVGKTQKKDYLKKIKVDLNVAIFIVNSLYNYGWLVFLWVPDIKNFYYE